MPAAADSFKVSSLLISKKFKTRFNAGFLLLIQAQILISFIKLAPSN